MRSLVVTLEGNIGAGKSTVLTTLRHRLSSCSHVAVIMEPADEWLEKGYLQRMYAGTVNRLSFQLMVLTSLASRLMVQLHEDATVLNYNRALSI